MKPTGLADINQRFPQPPPSIPPPEFEPAREWIQNRALHFSTACDTVGARLSIIAELERGWGRMVAMVPRTASDLAARLNSSLAAHRTAVAELTGFVETLNCLEEALAARADMRVNLEARKATLRDAKKLLDSPHCLRLDGDKLARLTAEVKHLPTLIKSDEQEIIATTTRISDRAKRAGIDLDLVIKEMVRKAANPEVGPLDRRILDHHEQGRLTAN